MAFAGSDSNSFAQGLIAPLSAEYAHYSAAKRRSPIDPHRGVPMQLMIDGLREDGQPPEAAWPYLTTVPVTLSDWVPPSDCTPIFRHAMLPKLAECCQIREALDAGHAGLFTARISEQFHRPPADYIIRDKPDDKDTGNHALIAVGHGEDSGCTLFLVRNSWGPGWCDRGYAWVEESYLSRRLLGLAVPFLIKREAT